MLHEAMKEITNGMEVVDKNQNIIGDVTLVMFSDNSPDTIGPDTVSADKPDMSTSPRWVDDFVSAFNLDNPMPEELQERLHREGFIRVHEENYLGDNDYYISLNQILNVTDDRVVLNTAKDNLMSF